MATNAAGLEEAAYIASEYIYSVDNLPGEVAHLLQEIRHKDARAQELQHDIDKDSARYIRHSLKASGSGSSSSSSSVPPSPSSKLISIPAKISSAYAEIQELAEEKEELARRLVALIERAQTRLDIELAKVRALSGDTTDYSYLVPKPLAGLPVSMDAIKNPALSMTESLKNALAGTPISEQRQTTPLQPSSPVSTSVAGSTSHKRRKVTAAPSIKVPATAWTQKRSASPTVQPATSQASHQRSRLSRQIHPATPEQDEDEDAEGDEEVEGDEGDDNRIYCYCQQQSFGDMIACDNEEDCPYEWFHLSCAGIKGAPPERWYCNVCKEKLADKHAASATSSSRKGRKK